MSEEEVFDIIIDSSEVNSGIIEKFEDSNFKYKVEQLPVADYFIRGTVLIERKEFFDFLRSLKDKSLFEEMPVMKATCQRTAVILERYYLMSLKKFESRFPIASIKGALRSLAVDFQMPIIYTTSLNDTFLQLCSIIKSIDKPQYESLYLRMPMRKGESPLQDVLNVVIGFPDVGMVGAVELLKHFGSIKELVNADTEEIMTISGFGKKKAEKIVKICNFEVEEVSGEERNAERVDT